MALAEVGRALVETSHVGTVAQRIADSVRGIVEVESVVLLQRDLGSGDLTSIALSGDVGPLAGPTFVLPKGVGLSGLAVRERRPVWAPDVLADPRFPLDVETRRRVARAAFRAALCVPLLVRGEVTGVLGVGSHAGRVFPAEEIRLLQAFADQAALTLEQARLYGEARRRERELEARRTLLQTTLEHLGQGVSVVDADLRLVAWNTQFLDLLGLPRAFGEVGKPFADFVRYNADRGEYGPGEPAEQVAQRVELARRFEPHVFVRVRPDGRVIEVHGSPMLGGGFVTTYTDVTERMRRDEALQRSEAHLRQAQKMEAVGRLAGGVAHDFNNLLTVIAGRSEILLRQLPSDDPRRRHVGLIEQTAFRAADLTRQLLAFSRKQVLRPRVLDPNSVVESLEGMLRRLVGEDIQLASRYRARGAIKADPGQLEQVIVNLAVNARDAMPRGGVLTLETADVVLDDAFVQTHEGARPGPHVLLVVADTGVGMDAEARAHVFEPFFTTKAPGRGTGLGLATVYGVVKQSEGYVWLDSAPGQGARFEIYLPRVDQRPERLDLLIDETGLPGGRETILLVEDQEDVRTLTREALQLAGYTVLEARNGREALQVSAPPAAAPDLLLTDVAMPRMGGRALADQLAARYSGLRVLYMSGHTDDAIVHHGVLDPGTDVLPKPFTPETLAKRVREILDRPGGLVSPTAPV